MLAVRIVRALFALSGAATYAWHLLWLRILGATLGQTEAALAATTVAVLGSLAAGSAAAGALADRCQPRTALRLFALVHAAAALLALAVPSALEVLVPFAVTAYADGEGGTWFASVRAAIATGSVVAPALLLGSSYPLAIRWLDGRERYPASGASWLFALHTLGGTLGVACATRLLTPRLGIEGVERLAAAVLLLVAAGAVLLEYVLSSTGATEHAGPDAQAAAKRTLLGASPAKARPWLARIAIFGSAFVLFAYQSIWTRILLLVVGPSTEVASLLTIFFWLGAAVGAAVATRLLRALTLGQVTVALGIVIALGGLCSLIAAWAVPQLPILIAAARIQAEGGLAAFAQPTFVIALIVMPMALALGSAFPLAVAIALPTRADAAQRAAGLWGLHLVGAIGGLLVASFVLIELFGLRWSVMGVALMALVIGVWVVLLAGETTVAARVFWAAAVGAATFSAFVLPEWEPRLLASGAYQLTAVKGPDVRTGLEASQMLFFEEGVAGTASVRRSGATTGLLLNGHVRASTGPDMVPQKMLAHLALLLHPMPRDACVLGLDTGITLGAALRHPLATVDVLEPSPEIVQAASYFATENQGALSDPRVRLIVGDAFAHGRLSARQYDVVISTPASLWTERAAVAVTKEFYEAARTRLKPNGVFAQWLPVSELPPPTFRAVLAAFAETFPEASAWLIPNAGIVLAGSVDAMAPRIQSVADQWDRPGLGQDLAALDAPLPAVGLSLWAGGTTTLRAVSAGAAAMSLDNADTFSPSRPGLNGAEPGALRLLEAQAGSEPLPPAVAMARNDVSPNRRLHTVRFLLRAGALPRALDELAQLAAVQPSDAAVLDTWSRAARGANRTADVRAFLSGALDGDQTNVSAAMALSRVLALEGRLEQAVDVARQAAERAPENVEPLIQLGMLAIDQGKPEALVPLLERLRSSDAAARPEVAFLAAHHAWSTSDLPVAIGLLGEVVAAQPENQRAWTLLGRVQLRAGNRNRASDAFRSAIRADPTVAANYLDLGQVELDAANAEGAVIWFSQALAIDARSVPATQGLAQALRRLGQTQRAADLDALVSPRR